MGFTVAFDLGDLIERLPFGTQFDVVFIDLATGVGIFHGEHPTVGKIAVVRNCKRLPTSLGLVIFEPNIEVQRICRAKRRLCRQR